MELIVIIIIIVFGLLIYSKNSNKKKPSTDDITKFEDVNYISLPIMTETEIKFYNILKQALPEHQIFTQVSTNAILKVTSKDRSHYLKVKNKYDPTCIDFVICDQNFNIVTIVELDDKTHDIKKEKDATRDYMTAKAGYKTVRFDCRKMPTPDKVKKTITKQ